jgi:hypothetical protein
MHSIVHALRHNNNVRHRDTMKRSTRTLFLLVSLVQLCGAVILVVYSFASSTADDRDVDDFARYHQAWQKIDRPQVDYTIQPERISTLAHDAILQSSHFSNTVLVASLVMIALSFTQLFLVASLPKSP